mgnify:CR=1 FL=1
MMPLTETTEEMMDKQFAVNVKGVFFGMKYQIPAMDGDGIVLNVSSMAGLSGAPKIVSYAAAKHAVIGLTKTAAVEYGKKGIRTNAVCPFFSLTPMVTETGMGTNASVDELESFLGRGSPMKRLGKPEEIVAVMLMCLSSASSYLNGQCIAIDGGVSAF